MVYIKRRWLCLEWSFFVGFVFIYCCYIFGRLVIIVCWLMFVKIECWYRYWLYWLVKNCSFFFVVSIGFLLSGVFLVRCLVNVFVVIKGRCILLIFCWLIKVFCKFQAYVLQLIMIGRMVLFYLCFVQRLKFIYENRLYLCFFLFLKDFFSEFFYVLF